MAIKIVTDSTSYIPEVLIQEYDIDVVSLSVIFNDEQYKETEISNEFFFNKLAKSTDLPTSSQISIEQLYGVFEKHVKNNNDIVAVFISSDMSGTYSTALLVKDMILEKYPDSKIEVVDSRSNCMQLGYATLTAARAASTGKSIEQVVKLTEDNITKSRFVFIPDTLEYLKKGGRIGTASALLGAIMQIKPILTVNDGKTDVIKKVRTKKKAIRSLMDIFMNDVHNYGLGEVTIHHINCEGEAKRVAEAISAELNQAVTVAPIGPVIGTHVGPGAIGIAYYTKIKLR